MLPDMIYSRVQLPNGSHVYIRNTHSNLSLTPISLSLSLFTDLFTNATVNRAMRYVWPFPALRETYIYLDGPLNDGNYGI